MSIKGHQVILSGQQIIDAASRYPSMIVGFCYDSSDILAGVYDELRSADGIRSAKIPGVDRPRRIEHGWCAKQDGTIIDSVFAEELRNDPELDPAAIQVTYLELDLPSVNRSEKLREDVRRRAHQTHPPLVSARRRWKFAEKERDNFRRWLEATGRIREP